MDLSPSLGEVSGRLALLQAIARRLVTPRGALWYDPAYGFDLRQFLSGITANTSQIASGIVDQAEQDERVSTAQAAVSFVGERLIARVAILDSSGPFTFTLAVSKVTVELLTQG